MTSVRRRQPVPLPRRCFSASSTPLDDVDVTLCNNSEKNALYNDNHANSTSNIPRNFKSSEKLSSCSDDKKRAIGPYKGYFEELSTLRYSKSSINTRSKKSYVRYQPPRPIYRSQQILREHTTVFNTEEISEKQTSLAQKTNHNSLGLDADTLNNNVSYDSYSVTVSSSAISEKDKTLLEHASSSTSYETTQADSANFNTRSTRLTSPSSCNSPYVVMDDKPNRVNYCENKINKRYSMNKEFNILDPKTNEIHDIDSDRLLDNCMTDIFQTSGSSDSSSFLHDTNPNGDGVNISSNKNNLDYTKSENAFIKFCKNEMMKELSYSERYKLVSGSNFGLGDKDRTCGGENVKEKLDTITSLKKDKESLDQIFANRFPSNKDGIKVVIENASDVSIASSNETLNVPGEVKSSNQIGNIEERRDSESSENTSLTPWQGSLECMDDGKTYETIRPKVSLPHDSMLDRVLRCFRGKGNDSDKMEIVSNVPLQNLNEEYWMRYSGIDNWKSDLYFRDFTFEEIQFPVLPKGQLFSAADQMDLMSNTTEGNHNKFNLNQSEHNELETNIPTTSTPLLNSNIKSFRLVTEEEYRKSLKKAVSSKPAPLEIANHSEIEPTQSWLNKPANLENLARAAYLESLLSMSADPYILNQDFFDYKKCKEENDQIITSNSKETKDKNGNEASNCDTKVNLSKLKSNGKKGFSYKLIDDHSWSSSIIKNLIKSHKSKSSLLKQYDSKKSKSLGNIRDICSDFINSTSKFAKNLNICHLKSISGKKERLYIRRKSESSLDGICLTGIDVVRRSIKSEDGTVRTYYSMMRQGTGTTSSSDESNGTPPPFNIHTHPLLPSNTIEIFPLSESKPNNDDSLSNISSTLESKELSDASKTTEEIIKPKIREINLCELSNVEFSHKYLQVYSSFSKSSESDSFSKSIHVNDHSSTLSKSMTFVTSINKEVIPTLELPQDKVQTSKCISEFHITNANIKISDLECNDEIGSSITNLDCVDNSNSSSTFSKNLSSSNKMYPDISDSDDKCSINSQTNSNDENINEKTPKCLSKNSEGSEHLLEIRNVFDSQTLYSIDLKSIDTFEEIKINDCTNIEVNTSDHFQSTSFRETVDLAGDCTFNSNEVINSTNYRKKENSISNLNEKCESNENIPINDEDDEFIDYNNRTKKISDFKDNFWEDDCKIDHLEEFKDETDDKIENDFISLCNKYDEISSTSVNESHHLINSNDHDILDQDGKLVKEVEFEKEGLFDDIFAKEVNSTIDVDNAEKEIEDSNFKNSGKSFHNK